MAGGCLTPGLNGGCANPGIGGGCLNTLRFGCGGLISLLLLIGLITMFLRGCNSEAVAETDDQKTEIETGEKKVDLTPWEIEDKDSSKQPNKDTLAQTKIKTIIVPNVQFYTNSAQLLPSSKEDLNTIALYMLENPTIKGVITGHTDSLGDEDKNQTLSLQRAENVMYYLMEYGVDQNQLSAKGKGEAEPIASNEKMEGRLMNRRVEITFYN
jgi:outer membrane protein OmpA-like peptidoglycan-associated protein